MTRAEFKLIAARLRKNNTSPTIVAIVADALAETSPSFKEGLFFAAAIETIRGRATALEAYNVMRPPVDPTLPKKKAPAGLRTPVNLTLVKG